MIRQGRSFSGHERNCCFLNTLGSNADNRFANISAISGLDVDDDGRALIHVDWDHDGDLDLWISNRNEPRLRFFRNDHPHENRFVQILIQGNGTTCNQNAIGARVTVVLKADGDDEPRKLIKTLRAGEGFIGQSTLCLQFGLGQSSEIDKVTVRWPDADGSTEEFTNLDYNRRFLIVQGAGEVTAVGDARDLTIEPGAIELPPASSVHRVPLVYQLSAPKIRMEWYDGEPTEYAMVPGNHTLINLWSTTCRPCLKELAEFSDRYDELQKAGIDVIGMSVDKLQSDDADAVEAAKELADRLGLKFKTGMAIAPMIDDLRRLHNTLIKLEKPLPLPTSFLIDSEGRLDVIYKGPVTVDTLLADRAASEKDLLTRYARAASFPGETIDNEVINSTLVNNEASIYFKVARELASLGRAPEAIEAYKLVLQIAPDTPTALNDLGVLYLQLKYPEAAEKHLRKAVDLNAQVDMQINLARSIIAQSRHDEALELLGGLKNDHPRNAEVHFNLGVLKTRMKDMQGALQSYLTAIDCDDQHSRAHFSLGGLYERDQKWADARKHYEKAHEADPNQVLILLNLGRVCFRETDYESARKYLQEAVDLHPTFPDAHYQLGVVLMQMGQRLAAKSEFEATVSLNPGHREARQALEQIARMQQ